MGVSRALVTAPATPVATVTRAARTASVATAAAAAEAVVVAATKPVVSAAARDFMRSPSGLHARHGFVARHDLCPLLRPAAGGDRGGAAVGPSRRRRAEGADRENPRAAQGCAGASARSREWR